MLEFAPHALDRVAERGVTREMVEEAWHRPLGQTAPGRRRDTRRFTGVTTKGTRLVIVVSGANRRRIITVWVAE